MNEEELVIAAQSGDNEAFQKLVSSYSGSLYKIAYCYLKDRQDALEAIQETTCRAFIKLKKLKQPQYFKTWLTRILINYCIDEVKRKRRFSHVLREESKDETSSSIDNIALESALNELNPRYKHVIILRYFHDLSIPDIADSLECPEGTVKTWIHRALKHLKESLGKEGDYNV